MWMKGFLFTFSCRASVYFTAWKWGVGGVYLSKSVAFWAIKLNGKYTWANIVLLYLDKKSCRQKNGEGKVLEKKGSWEPARVLRWEQHSWIPVSGSIQGICQANCLDPATCPGIYPGIPGREIFAGQLGIESSSHHHWHHWIFRNWNPISSSDCLPEWVWFLGVPSKVNKHCQIQHQLLILSLECWTCLIWPMTFCMITGMFCLISSCRSWKPGLKCGHGKDWHFRKPDTIWWITVFLLSSD